MIMDASSWSWSRWLNSDLGAVTEDKFYRDVILFLVTVADFVKAELFVSCNGGFLLKIGRVLLKQ